MNSERFKIPGPDHPITITPAPERITVMVAGRRIADTCAALTLKETTYRPVHYIPRKDVDMTQLERTSHQTYCPYKGECAYYSIPAGGEPSVNGVWTYEAPYAAVSEIQEYLAFYPDRVDAIQIANADEASPRIVKADEPESRSPRRGVLVGAGVRVDGRRAASLRNSAPRRGHCYSCVERKIPAALRPTLGPLDVRSVRLQIAGDSPIARRKALDKCA